MEKIQSTEESSDAKELQPEILQHQVQPETQSPSPVPQPVLEEHRSESESESDATEEIATPLSNQEKRLQRKLNKMKGGKGGTKWRKARKLINLAIKVAGEGSVQPGRGSGTNLNVGGRRTNIHRPHGRDSTRTDPGRMRSLQGLISDGSRNDKNI
ncbi:MAG: hypothetical protein ABFQ95_03285 [Pseudomonadota bacterium]